MGRLSSTNTFAYKWVLPFILLGVLVLIVMSEVSKGGLPLTSISIILTCFAFFCFLMKKYFFNLVDEVLDAGDALLIRNGRLEERIVLSEIINASYSLRSRFVFLKLARPSIFGRRVISFVPYSGLHVYELFDRIEAARRAAAVLAKRIQH